MPAGIVYVPELNQYTSVRFSTLINTTDVTNYVTAYQ